MKQGNYNLGNYRGYVQTRLQGVLSPLQALKANVQGVRVLLGHVGNTSQQLAPPEVSSGGQTLSDSHSYAQDIASHSAGHSECPRGAQ